MIGKIKMKPRVLGGKVKLAVVVCCLLFSVSLSYGGYSVVELEPPAAESETQTNSADRIEPHPIESTEVVGKEVEKVALREVIINLRGATEYETVEIFNRLLESMSLVSDIERLRMVIVPSRPGQCLATWKVMTVEQDTFTIESQLYGGIKKLDQEGNNDVLEGLHFSASEDDIEMVKKIKPTLATASALNFSLELVQDRRVRSSFDKELLYAGFD